MIESPIFSLNAFCAGAAAYGIATAANAAHTYGVPIEVCLAYLAHYSKFGYRI